MPGQHRGTVVDADGVPLLGAWVEIVYSDGSTQRARVVAANSNGPGGRRRVLGVEFPDGTREHIDGRAALTWRVIGPVEVRP